MTVKIHLLKINNHQKFEKCGTNSNNNCIDLFQQLSNDFFNGLCVIFFDCILIHFCQEKAKS